MDPSNAPASTGVMIALLPQDPIPDQLTKVDFPHLTLVYAGTTDSLKPTEFNELAKDACAIAMMQGPLVLRVKGVDVFGDQPDQVDVLTLVPSQELLAMRETVDMWTASEYDFSPHVTIGPQGSNLEPPPYTITFDKIVTSWGDTNITFWLKGGGRNYV